MSASPAPASPLTVDRVLPRGEGLAAPLLRRAARVSLDWDTRQRSRFQARDSQGRALAVFLPRGQVVRGGDVLLAQDGSLIVVEAAAESLLRITVRPDGGRAFDLLRAAYHLGNRHVPMELQETLLQIEPDHVLAEMLVALGLQVTAVEAGFEPEGGAYGSGHGGGHGHSHGHSHGQDHDHDHGPLTHTHGAPA